MFITALFLRSFLTMAIIVMSVTASTAADISWGPATNIVGESNVSTLGTLVGAFNIGPTGVPDTTVNGVLFQGFAVPLFSTSATFGNFTLTRGPENVGSSFLSRSDLGSALPPFSSLSAAYQTLLSSGTGTPDCSFTLTITGLSVGTIYQFQWWDNDSHLGAGVRTIATAGPNITPGASVTLSSNTGDGGGVGGIGQFAIGNFMADTDTQIISFRCPTAPLGVNNINAFQLRVIPEPSTWLLLILGALPFAGLRPKGESHGRIRG